MDKKSEPVASLELVFAKLDRNEVKRELVRALIQQVGRDPAFATNQDWFYALACFVRGRLSAGRIRAWRRQARHDTKWVYYLSLEYLPGRLLKTCLLTQGLYQTCLDALSDLNVDLNDLWDCEVEPALGNGGLGRLAACLLESMASLNFAGMGYGIRYEYGMFRQKIENGEQVEHPENWLKDSNPWEYPRANVVYPIQFGGHAAQINDRQGGILCHWTDTNDVMAAAYDMPVVGVDGETVSSIRLWSAKATSDFDLTYFNRGNYIDAVKEKSETETLSKVLYPSDTTSMGRELRLKQEYFLVSASLQDVLTRFLRGNASLDLLPQRVAIQLNDTHPVLAIPEMMRLLVDVHRLEWDRAWAITVATCGFTNHTLLSEALEKWPLGLLEKLLPRHLQIIYEINHRFLREVGHRYPGDVARLRRMSLIDENEPRSVRMAHLAVVGSHRVNGVSLKHTDIMRKTLFADFEETFPRRIVSVTNGISQRRWLNEANPALARLISARISGRWLRGLEGLEEIADFADDDGFQSVFAAVKQSNKDRLAALIKQRIGIAVDPSSLFDLHIKRIHEYKRQLLNIIRVVAHYGAIRSGGTPDLQPRTVIFSGKAAPGYVMAKRIIHLINSVADIVNHDPAVEGMLKIVFVPNYDVQTAEDLIPAADLSEQISTAGTEASGTGNMKLSLNGALTIATHDGANDELCAAVGPENIFMFGHTYEELQGLRRRGYVPAAFCARDPSLREALAMIGGGYFSPGNRDLFAPVVDSLLREGDTYMVLADYAAYAEVQKGIDRLYQDRRSWMRKAILNVARMSNFSIDRVTREYAAKIWDAAPVPPRI